MSSGALFRADTLYLFSAHFGVELGQVYGDDANKYSSPLLWRVFGMLPPSDACHMPRGNYRETILSRFYTNTYREDRDGVRGVYVEDRVIIGNGIDQWTESVINFMFGEYLVEYYCGRECYTSKQLEGFRGRMEAFDGYAQTAKGIVRFPYRLDWRGRIILEGNADLSIRRSELRRDRGESYQELEYRIMHRLVQLYHLCK